jgi:hypothetical protein
MYLNSLIIYLFKHHSEPFKVNVKMLVRAAAHPARTLEPPLVLLRLLRSAHVY